jgi:hypothetical protein
MLPGYVINQQAETPVGQMREPGGGTACNSESS